MPTVAGAQTRPATWPATATIVGRRAAPGLSRGNPHTAADDDQGDYCPRQVRALTKLSRFRGAYSLARSSHMMIVCMAVCHLPLPRSGLYARSLPSQVRHRMRIILTSFDN